MTLYDLSLSYKETASTLRTRIVELEKQSKEEIDPIKAARLMNRIRPLRSMYRDVRQVARWLENYYPKWRMKT